MYLPPTPTDTELLETLWALGLVGQNELALAVEYAGSMTNANEPACYLKAIESVCAFGADVGHLLWPPPPPHRNSAPVELRAGEHIRCMVASIENGRVALKEMK